MIRYVSVDAAGRIMATTEFEEYAEGMRLFEFPDNFDFLIQNEYRIENDRLIHDKLPPTEEEIRLQKEAEYRSELETATLMFVRTSAVNLSDEEALNVHMLFEEWNETNHFLVGRIYRYETDIYRCLKEHDKQATWTPDQAHSLFVRVRPKGMVSEWEPVVPGINEPYSKGDKVTYGGKTWVSNIDNNVWKPGEYGWTEIPG